MMRPNFMEKLLDGVEVEWKALGEVGEFTYGYAAKAQDSGDARFIRITDININGKLIPTNAKFVDITEENERFILKKNDLLMARTGATYGKTLIFEEDYPAIFAGFLIKLSFDKKIINPKYYWHFSQSEFFWQQANKLVSGGGQPQFNANAVREVKIPIPPLEIQAEIVRILDAFAELTAELASELASELTARRKQYEYYRDKLLTFDEGEVEWKTLGEISLKVSSGGTPLSTREDFYGGEIPWLRTQEVQFNEIFDTNIKITEMAVSNSSAKWIPANCVIVAISGATAARSAINKIPLTTNQHCCNFEINSNIACYRYVFHWVCKEYENIKALGQGARSDLNAGIIKAYRIPIPYPSDPAKSLEEQARIVSILDKFDALTSSITEGLPREIELCQKQYEYYRNMLLSFPENPL